MIRFAVIMRTACFPQISYRKILVKFSTYPDPLEWVLLLEDITTTESLNQSSQRYTLAVDPVPEPSPLPPSISAGCEPELVISVTDLSVLPQPGISAGYEENPPPSVSAPDQAPCESIEATADHCNITSDEPRSCVLTVAAQLNDSGLLVGTRAKMSANSRVRKTPQPTLIYYKKWSRHEPVTGLESREIQTRSQES